MHVLRKGAANSCRRILDPPAHTPASVPLPTSYNLPSSRNCLMASLRAIFCGLVSGFAARPTVSIAVAASIVKYLQACMTTAINDQLSTVRGAWSNEKKASRVGQVDSCNQAFQTCMA